MKKLTFLSLFFCATLFCTAQITTTPAFIQKGYTGEITITFNPNEGNKGMVGATSCYAHTGLITSASQTDSDWKYATTTWRGGEAKYKMTKVGTNWQLVIPNIYTFYGCPQSTEILKMAFVFNDGPNGQKEGKTASGGDIYISLVEPGLVARIEEPVERNMLLSAGDVLNFRCVSSEEATLSLSLDGVEQTSATGYELTYALTFPTEGSHKVRFEATTATESKADSLQITVMSATTELARPAGKEDMGIYYDPEDETKVTLVTYAASKTEPAKAVYVVGDFNRWELNTDYQMYRDGNFFWIELDNLTPKREYAYQYWVVRADGKMVKISDGYSHKVLHKDDAYEPRTVDPTLKSYPTKADGSYVSVFQTGQEPYAWSDATLNFVRPDKNNLVIYEMWVYDYTPERSIEGVRKRLSYLQNLGVNAIELMPICEFEGNYNWGYSPTHYFAPDKAYGSETQIKNFIDECHQRGIAVIMDMVFNHATGLNPQNKLYPYGPDLANNPWFNASAPHSDNVYEDWNHGFEQTRLMFTKVLQYWLTEFKVDGFRMDLSHGFCGPNCNDRMDNINHYYTEGVQAASPGAYFILEHWGDKMGSERPVLIRNGMLCWNNTNGLYTASAKGLLSSSFAEANKDGYVSYCESHDEERNFYEAKKNGIEVIRTDENLRLSRVALNMAFNVLLNGPHMIWQWNELGYDYSINSTKGSSNISSGNRCSKKEQPESLGWLNGGIRMAQYQKLAQAIHLRTHLAPQVFEGDPVSVNIGSTQAVRTIVWGTGLDAIVIVGNFSPTDAQTVRLPDGSWYDYFYQIPQRTGVLSLAPGELRIFTAKQYQLPQVPVSYDFTTALDNVTVSEMGIEVSPTLTSGEVFFSQAVGVTVFDLSGRQMLQAKNATSVNLSGLNNGLYLLTLQADGRQSTVKVIKQ